MGFGSDKTGFYKPSAVTVTASGNPLTLQNAKRLRKLTIYGNAVQDGTPSPDAPVEVQLCGDRTGNLLDASTIYVKNSGGNVDFDGKTIHVHSDSTGEVMWFWTNVYVQQGKTYAIQYSDSTCPISYAFSTEAITEYSSDVFANNTTIQNKFATFTATETGYLRIVFKLPVNTPDGTIERLQVIEGSYTADTLPAYESYGYKVSGRVDGLNLLDTENIIENTEDTTVKIEEYQGKKCLTWTDGGNTSKQHFMQGKFKENTQYTFRFSGYSKNNMQISIVYTDGSHSGRVIPGGKGWNEIIFQSPSGKSIDYWSGWHNYGQKVAIDIDSSMIIEGSYTAETMPPYEPYQPPQDFAVYLPEQIAKVGDVADEVVVDMERKTAELKKKYFRYDFTGDENWNYAEVYNRFSLNLKLGLQSKRYKTPSNRFETTNIAGNKDGLIFAYTSSIFVYHYDSTTKEEFNAFLTDNPTYAYIPYSTPVTTDITSLQQWDAMPQVSGTVTLTLSAEVDPSGAEAVYTVTKRPKAQAHGADAVR